MTKIRTVLEQTVTAKKAAEGQIAAMNPKLNELSGLTNTLNNAKVKLEKDLAAVRTEYTDIARELKLADERANKASHDAQHFEGLLREESAKFVKVENIKKALETEVRSLTIRMEEIETNSVATSRRTIQKMEQRIGKKRHLLVDFTFNLTIPFQRNSKSYCLLKRRLTLKPPHACTRRSVQ